MLCTGLGAGAGAGGVLGGARVGDGGGAAAGWVAAGDACALAGALRALCFLAACVCVAVGVGLGVAAADGLTTVWLLAVCAGALRAKRTAKAAAAIALSWVVRQVSRESRRRPWDLPPPAGSSKRRVGSLGGGISGRDELAPGHSWSCPCGGYLSRMGRHSSGIQVKSPPRMAQEPFAAPVRRASQAVPLRDMSLTSMTSAQVRMHGVSSTYAGWRGHVIVCGLHGVGLRIVELLNASGVPTVVIDDHPDLRQARNLIGWGIPHIAGSSRSAEVLAEAGLAGAEAVICAQEDDLRTLETALLTRELRADVRVVVQLSNPAVGRALARIAISVLDVAGLSAPSITEACLRTGVQEIRLAGERFAAARTIASPRPRCVNCTGRWPRSPCCPRTAAMW